ncbi:ATP-binding cassette domain-containing protein [Streptococcus danieliae]|uniref:ATP-binding cassette domain-containing protein n=1 Tax=Streptococcus danieliae TaxID=747656 RepID=UPI0026EC25B9|nr:ATP-binding cassette domain-containing protein [Streptococcus danieliae]
MSDFFKVHNIHKSYKEHIAVDQVSFNLQKGEICGLVGENGAGKTTLLRLLTGLIRPDQGEIQVQPGLKTGALIESPALQLHLSAQDNLRYLGLQLGISNLEKRIATVLALVGLDQVDSRKKSKDFSLGMRQRLAIGLSILHQPDFLILDEPINGLDPAGIREMRSIIHNLREQAGMTILISSHILSELEMVVDRYLIMHQGKLVRQITKEELEAQVAGSLCLESQQIQEVAALLNRLELSFHQEGTRFFLPEATPLMPLLQEILAEGLVIEAAFHQRHSLEDYYLTLIHGGTPHAQLS